MEYLSSLEETLEWTGKPLSPREFLDSYRHRLPAVVRLSAVRTVGQARRASRDGSDDPTDQQRTPRNLLYSAGCGSYVDFCRPNCQKDCCRPQLSDEPQTSENNLEEQSTLVWLEAVVRQQRAAFRMLDSRYVTIPVNTTQRVHVVNRTKTDHRDPAMTLKTALAAAVSLQDSEQQPLYVTLEKSTTTTNNCNNNNNNSNSNNSRQQAASSAVDVIRKNRWNLRHQLSASVGVLQYVGCFQSSYLVGRRIVTGSPCEVELSDAVVVELNDQELMLDVATGLQRQPQLEFRRLKDLLTELQTRSPLVDNNTCFVANEMNDILFIADASPPIDGLNCLQFLPVDRRLSITTTTTMNAVQEQATTTKSASHSPNNNNGDSETTTSSSTAAPSQPSAAALFAKFPVSVSALPARLAVERTASSPTGCSESRDLVPPDSATGRRVGLSSFQGGPSSCTASHSQLVKIRSNSFGEPLQQPQQQQQQLVDALDRRRKMSAFEMGSKKASNNTCSSSSSSAKVSNGVNRSSSLIVPSKKSSALPVSTDEKTSHTENIKTTEPSSDAPHPPHQQQPQQPFKKTLGLPVSYTRRGSDSAALDSAAARRKLDDNVSELRAAVPVQLSTGEPEVPPSSLTAAIEKPPRRRNGTSSMWAKSPSSGCLHSSAPTSTITTPESDRSSPPMFAVRASATDIELVRTEMGRVSAPAAMYLSQQGDHGNDGNHPAVSVTSVGDAQQRAPPPAIILDQSAVDAADQATNPYLVLLPGSDDEDDEEQSSTKSASAEAARVGCVRGQSVGQRGGAAYSGGGRLKATKSAPLLRCRQMSASTSNINRPLPAIPDEFKTSVVDAVADGCSQRQAKLRRGHASNASLKNPFKKLFKFIRNHDSTQPQQHLMTPYDVNLSPYPDSGVKPQITSSSSAAAAATVQQNIDAYSDLRAVHLTKSFYVETDERPYEPLRYDINSINCSPNTDRRPPLPSLRRSGRGNTNPTSNDDNNNNNSNNVNNSSRRTSPCSDAHDMAAAVLGGGGSTADFRCISGGGSAAGLSRRPTLTDLRDIPSDIRTLSVAEVGDCLRLLAFDERCVEEFARHYVDGALLSAVDEPLLQSSFALTPLEARKLFQFARNGWRPRID